jgi:hypothetical protein
MITDDFAATTSTAGAVAAGGSATGEIETTGDADWFKITLQAGVTYRFDLEGTDTGQGTLEVPVLELRNAVGSVLLSDAFDSSDGPGPGANAQLTYTAAASGTFFLASHGSGNDIGTYKLSATVLSTSLVDDFAATTSTAGAVAAGGSATGEIETTGDADWFKITLQAGVTYRFDLEGTDTGQGTLEVPVLELRNAAGSVLLSDAFDSSDGPGPGANAQLTYTAAASGTFFLASHGSGNDIGTYKLSASEVPSANNLPALGGDNAITVAEGGRVVVTTADLTATDSDNIDAQLVYTVTGASHGTVLKSDAATASFTQADLAANLISFEHDGSELAGSFTVSITDGTAPPQSATVAATVSPHVNDAPSEISGGPLSVAENSAAGTLVGTVTGQDADDATLAYTLTDDAGGRFAIDSAAASWSRTACSSTSSRRAHTRSW